MKAFRPHFTFVGVDCEFVPHNHAPNGLISLALHSERGDFYAVNADLNVYAVRDERAWMRENVWSKLPLTPDGDLDRAHPDVRPYAAIRAGVDDYFRKIADGRTARESIGLVADHGVQDVQRIHTLWGNDWAEMPVHVPKRLFQDLSTLEDLAGVVDDHLPDGTPLPIYEPDLAHHALRDARYDLVILDFLLKHSRAVRVACGVEYLES